MGVFPFTRNKGTLPHLELSAKFKWNSYFQTEFELEPFDKLVELEEANISSNYHIS